MHGRFVVVLLALLGVLFLTSGSVLAQTAWTSDDQSVVFRVGGETTIGPDETTGTVIMIDGDVVIDGRVTQALWVTNGTATINGQVDGEVLVMNGTLNLAAGSTVRNVSLVRSQLDRADGATVTGTLNDQVDLGAIGWGAAIFTFVFWIGVTIVILVAGLVFAALGYGQLVDAARTLATRPGESILTALILWIGLPILAVLAFVTVIGIPLGVLILILILPLLWLLGYIVVGEALGGWLGRLAGLQPQRYLSVLIGLVALQLISLVPAIGGPIGIIAGLLGAGALVYRIYHGRRGPEAVPTATVIAPA